MEVIMTNDVTQRMKAYVMSVKTEISGLAKAHLDKEKDAWIVDDIAIFEQKVSGSETELSTQQLAKFITELVQKGEDPSEWCVWWHSHADMNVFWSGTDTDTMDKWNTGPILISIVTNRKQEYRARLDVYNPVHLYIDNLKLTSIQEEEKNTRLLNIQSQIEALTEQYIEITDKRDKKITDAIKKEVDAKVTPLHTRATTPQKYNPYKETNYQKRIKSPYHKALQQKGFYYDYYKDEYCKYNKTTHSTVVYDPKKHGGVKLTKKQQKEERQFQALLDREEEQYETVTLTDNTKQNDDNPTCLYSTELQASSEEIAMSYDILEIEEMIHFAEQTHAVYEIAPLKEALELANKQLNTLSV